MNQTIKTKQLDLSAISGWATGGFVNKAYLTGQAGLDFSYVSGGIQQFINESGGFGDIFVYASGGTQYITGDKHFISMAFGIPGTGDGFVTYDQFKTGIDGSGFTLQSAINTSGFLTGDSVTQSEINTSGFMTGINGSGFVTQSTINSSGFATGSLVTQNSLNISGFQTGVISNYSAITATIADNVISLSGNFVTGVNITGGSTILTNLIILSGVGNIVLDIVGSNIIRISG